MENWKRFLILLVTLSILATYAGAQTSPEQIPGGIVYSDGKDAIYQRFTTEDKINLTNGGIGTPVTGPIFVAQDLSVMAWASTANKKATIYLKYMPDGTPIRFCEAAEGEVESLSISSDNEFVSFSTPSGHMEVIHIKSQAFQSQAIYKQGLLIFKGFHFPTWTREKRTITDADTFAKAFQEFSGDPGLINKFAAGTENYNTGGKLLTQVFPQMSAAKGKKPLQVYRYPASGNKAFALGAQIEGEGEQRLTALYKDDSRAEWGPIGFLHWGHQDRFLTYSYGKRWSMPLQESFYGSRKEFCGFSPKPDGTLTYLADDKVLSEAGKVLASGIKAANLIWVSDSAFIYLGKDGIYSRQVQNSAPASSTGPAGEIERMILSLTPKQFCYCPDSPARNYGKNKVAQVKAVKPHEGFIVLDDFTLLCVKENFFQTDEVQILLDQLGPKDKVLSDGDVEFWKKLNESGAFLKPSAVRIAVEDKEYTPAEMSGKVQMMSPITEYCVVDEKDLSRITDPSSYTFKRYLKDVFCQQGEQIIVLRRKGKYVAIKIISIAQEMLPIGKLYTENGAGVDQKGRYAILYAPYSPDPVIYYEWKYWPEAKPKK